MATEQPKQAHRAIIRQRAEDLAGKLNGIGDVTERATLVDEILWETSLESWNNGLKAGRRRASQKTGESA